MTTETIASDNTAPVRQQTAIDAVADAYTDTLIRLNPSFATELGLPGHETEYPDLLPRRPRGIRGRKPRRHSRRWTG